MSTVTPDRAAPTHVILSDPSAYAAERITVGFLAQYRRHTREAYELDLRLWGRFLAEHDIDPLAVTRTHIELWIRQGEERGLATSTIGRRLGTVRGWYRFAVDEGYLDEDPGRKIKPPKIHLREDLPYLDRWDMARIVEAAQEHERIEALTLILILGYNGLRISEALSLDVDNYTRTGGFHTVHLFARAASPPSCRLPATSPVPSSSASTGGARARCSATPRVGV